MYTLDLKSKEDLSKIIKECKDANHKRIYIDLGIHIKQHLVNEMWLVEKVDGKYQRKTQIHLPQESEVYGTMPCLQNLKSQFENMPNVPSALQSQSKLKSWYLTPQMQAKMF